MNAARRPNKPGPNLVLTALLSASLTVLLSIITIILCMIALIFRYDCTAAQDGQISGSGHLTSVLYRVYIQDQSCNTSLTLADITSDYSVFILMIITLVASCLCLVAAIVLILVVKSQSTNNYFTVYAYGYIGVCVASLVVDVTFASHFGMDYSHVSGMLDNFSPGLSFNYDLDMIRIGAFFLMAITLKGFMSHLVNLVLLSLLVKYLVDYSKTRDKYEHSIHSLGVLSAFGPKREIESTLQRRFEMSQNNISNGGSQISQNDDERLRHIARTNSRRDDFAPEFDRSHSWQQGSVPASRPFSYLEEPRQPARAPPSPAAEPHWRRDPWPGTAPPVPAPDYSPQAPRRLKSALKPAYM